jgi:hypothetical protein
MIRTTGRNAHISQEAWARVCDGGCAAQPAHRPIAARADGANRRIPPAWPQLQWASQAAPGQGPTVAEKYDYLYSEKELEEIARAAGALTRVRKSVSSGLDALRKFLLKRLLEDLL